MSSNLITTPHSYVSTSSRSTPGTSLQGSLVRHGLEEDLWNLQTDSSQDSLFSHPSTHKNFNPAITASKNLLKYLQPEVAKQFNT